MPIRANPNPSTSPTLRRARKVAVCVIGFTLILLGLVLIVVPGPLTIPPVLAGLAILATEFVWARRMLNKVKATSVAAKDKVSKALGMKKDKEKGA